MWLLNPSDHNMVTTTSVWQMLRKYLPSLSTFVLFEIVEPIDDSMHLETFQLGVMDLPFVLCVAAVGFTF